MPISICSNDSLAMELVRGKRPNHKWAALFLWVAFYGPFCQLRADSDSVFVMRHSTSQGCCSEQLNRLTVQLLQSTAYTCCGAEQKLLEGTLTFWGNHLQDLGPIRSTHTACWSNSCWLHSWNNRITNKTLVFLIDLNMEGPDTDKQWLFCT